jgi:hypothetical protein
MVQMVRTPYLAQSQQQQAEVMGGMATTELTVAQAEPVDIMVPVALERQGKGMMVVMVIM